MDVSQNLKLIFQAKSFIIKDEDKNSICQSVTKILVINHLSISRKEFYEQKQNFNDLTHKELDVKFKNASKNVDQNATIDLKSMEESRKNEEIKSFTIVPAIKASTTTTIIYPLCATIKLELSKYNNDLSAYCINILVEVQAMKIDISNILLKEFAETLKIWIECYKRAKRLHDLIYNYNVFENKNDEKISIADPKFKKFSETFNKIGFQIKRKNILQNILTYENQTFYFNESDLKECLDNEIEIAEFYDFLNDLNEDSLCLTIKTILNDRFSSDNNGRFEQQPTHFLINYINVRNYDREFESFMSEIMQMSDEMIKSQMRKDIKSESSEYEVIFKCQQMEISLKEICTVIFDDIDAILIENNEVVNFQLKIPYCTLNVIEVTFQSIPLKKSSDINNNDNSGVFTFIFGDLQFSSKFIKKKELKDSVHNFDFSVEKVQLFTTANENEINEDIKIVIQNEEFDLSKKNSLSIDLKFQKTSGLKKILVTYIKARAQDMILNQHEWIYLLCLIRRFYELKNDWEFYEIDFDLKAIDDLMKLKKSIFEKICGIKLNNESERFLLLSKSGEIDFDIELFKNSIHKTNESIEQEFKWICENCYLYHYIKGTYVKLSNPFDFEIKYITQTNNRKLSKLMIYIKPFKLFTNEICLKSLINFVNEFNFLDTTKRLNFGCKLRLLYYY